LIGSNAYSLLAGSTSEKSFKTLATRVNVIKLFFFFPTVAAAKKLVHLSLASFLQVGLKFESMARAYLCPTPKVSQLLALLALDQPLAFFFVSYDTSKKLE